MSRETFHESLEQIEMELLSMGELAPTRCRPPSTPSCGTTTRRRRR